MKNEKLNRVGFISYVVFPSLEKQTELLKQQGCVKIYEEWKHIKPSISKTGINRNSAVREGDTIFMYDLWILGNTEKVMLDRLDLLFRAGINVQISRPNKDHIFPLKYTRTMYDSLRRAKRKYSHRRTIKAGEANAERIYAKKLDEARFQKIFTSWLGRVEGTSKETTTQAQERLGERSNLYYEYLDRYILQLANKEWEYPREITKDVWHSILILRKIYYSKEDKRFVRKKDVEKRKRMVEKYKRQQKLNNKN